jgi:hypothetical protein
MALTVTPGSATADSYVTLSGADSYHAALGNTAWTGTDASKEAALRRATAWVDGCYAGRWPGIPVYARLQALAWPRSYADDTDGNPVDPATIPPEVISATCEAALRELASPGSLSPDVTPGTAKVLTGLGSLSWTPLRSSAGPNDMTPSLTIVDRILAPLVGGANTVQVVRA